MALKLSKISDRNGLSKKIFMNDNNNDTLISSYRKNLLSLVGFTPIFAFSLISQGTNEKYITVKEIFDFLRENNHYKTEREVAAYIKFKAEQELRLSYNEFTQIVGSHPKQVAQVSLEVQSTQRNKIRQSLSSYLSLLVESNTIIRKLKKDISTNFELDYHELQELLDPSHIDEISFETLRRFMEDCGKSLQRGDFEEIKEHIAPGIVSSRMRFKDLVRFLSNKTVTSVVVHQRKNVSNSRSPSRERTQNDLSFQSSSSSFYRSTAKSGALYQPSAVYENKFKSTSFTQDPRRSPSPIQKRHLTQNSSTLNDSISPKHLSLSQSQSSFVSASNNRRMRSQDYQQDVPQNLTQSSVMRSTLSSTSYVQKAASPLQNKKYEPSLFKDPSLNRPGNNISDFQLQATTENFKRIRAASRTPKKYEASFDSKQNFGASRDFQYQASLNKSRNVTEVSSISDSLAEQNFEQVKSATTYIVGFFQILKDIGSIEEMIEDNKKRLARATQFSPWSIFESFDREGKGYLRQSIFVELLAALDIRLSDQDIKLLFARIERNQDGFISVQEFTDIFRPEDPDYEDLFEHKQHLSKRTPLNSSLIQETKYAKALMNSLVEREKRLRKSLDQLRRSRNFDKYLLFSSLDENNDGIITTDELAVTLRSYNILLKQSTHRLVFNLLDRSGTGQIQYSDFVDFISK